MEVKWDNGQQRYLVMISQISDCRKIKRATEIKRDVSLVLQQTKEDTAN